MSQPITLDALKVLDAIDRKGSFAAAANALYRVPSAVTYSVQKLEDELGVVLFRKEGRRSLLTPAGRVLLEQGREILDAVERLVETTRQTDSGWESRVNIAVDSILDLADIYVLIERFYQLKPDIEINLFEEVLGGAWESIQEGRADLVVGAPGTPINAAGIRQQKLRDIEWVLAVAPSHPLASREGKISRTAMEAYRAVVVRDSSRSLAPLTLRVFSRQPALTVATVQEKIRAQCMGLGIGFLPRHRIQDLLARGDLVGLQMEEPAEDSELFLSWKVNHKGRALDWFVREITASTICR